MEPIAETNPARRSSSPSATVEDISRHPQQGIRPDNADDDDPFKGINESKPEVQSIVEVFREAIEHELKSEGFKNFITKKIRSESIVSAETQSDS